MVTFDPTKYGAKIVNTPNANVASSGVGARVPIGFDPTQYGAKATSGGNFVPQPTQVEPQEETYGATFPATGKETPLVAGAKAAGNLPSSAINLAKGFAQLILHPIQSAKGIIGTGVGAAQKLVPGEQAQEVYPNALVEYVKSRYGSIENAQKTSVNDPVGFATDLLTLIGGGAAVAGKTAELGKIGSTIASPVTKPLAASGRLAKLATEETATALAGTATGAGKEAFKQALRGEGGFTDAMRGKINLTDTLNEAQIGLSQVKELRGTTYRQAMENLKRLNPKSLEITPILSKARELTKQFNIKQLPDGTLDLSRSPLVKDASKVNSIFNLLDEWGTVSGDRTVVGVDLLKRQLRDFREPMNPTLNRFVDDLANSARSVSASVPGYENIQKTYGNYSNFIDELERTLSLKESATPDQAITKLNSLLKENKDYRRILASELKQITGKDILAPIAGQALSGFTPQGLSKLGALGGTAVGVASGISLPSILPYLAVTSPRIMGEFFRAIGVTGRTIAPILKNINDFRVGAGLQAIKVKLPKGVQEYIENPKLGLSIEDVTKGNKAQGGVPYKGEKDLTTKILKDLEGKTTVSKQYILDATNRGELKQVERDLIRDILERETKIEITPKEYKAFLNAQDFGATSGERINSATGRKLGSTKRPYGDYLYSQDRDMFNNQLYNENLKPSQDLLKFIGKDKDTINVSDFAKKVKAELLPLEVKSTERITPKDFSDPRGAYPSGKMPRYENINLPDELRGKVKNYKENIYESPISTSAGDTHFSGSSKNYFGHTRIEDMADNKTRRVIEVQSDLYQKGNLEDEFSYEKRIQGKDKTTYDALKREHSNLGSLDDDKARELYQKMQKIKDKWKDSPAPAEKLKQYNDPTAHFRMVREEIKKAAQDGKTKLQFPTGETAMKIEGLGDRHYWFQPRLSVSSPTGRQIGLSDLKVGKEIEALNDDKWIITDVLGDGKFKAVPKHQFDPMGVIEKSINKESMAKLETGGIYNKNAVETFDISGKVDTNNPIYKFYEKDMQKYLTKFGGKQVVDDKGVSWIEVPIKKEWAKMPVEAFGVVGAVGLGALSDEKERQ